MTSWKYRILALALLCGGTLPKAFAQQDDSKNIIDVPEQLSETEQLEWKKKLPTDGWLLLHFKEGDRLLNLSHKDYILHLWLSCAGGKGAPGYLVEYSDAYRDGDYGGIDFISSTRDDGREVLFLLDGKKYGNPFAQTGSPQFGDFAAALKQAKLLTLSVYDTEMNPETGRNEQRLNRSIDFKLAHNQLLDKPVICEE